MDIKELRKSKKLTQVAFAQAVGIKARLITAVETGKKALSEDVIAKIKEVFGVEVDAKVKSAPKRSLVKKTVGKKKGKESPAKKRKESSAKKGLIIQSPLGGEITPEEVLAKVGKVDVVYVRVDENKAYWVKGKKNGAVDLW
ncbi:MAG: helix-turn-helix transcriptional regulator [Fretibacterium sp.]|nr:helix-turn-helix transcriptional regulator [Fretibacterium sp.]